MPDQTPLNLKVDHSRIRLAPGEGTGIFFRATLDGKWGSYDLCELDKESVRRLLDKMRHTHWADNIIGVMLGHGHLWEDGPTAVKREGRG